MFVNLVETDQVYGHRQDVPGFHGALKEIDAAVGRWLERLDPDEDLLVLTADHGCDPTTPGTDHTREHVPLLARFTGHGGRRHDGPFADVGRPPALARRPRRRDLPASRSSRERLPAACPLTALVAPDAPATARPPVRGASRNHGQPRATKAAERPSPPQRRRGELEMLLARRASPWSQARSEATLRPRLARGAG